MKPLPALALLLLGGLAGWLLGREGADGDRRAVSERRSAERRSRARVEEERDRAVEENRRLQADVAALRDRVASSEAEVDAAPKPGERLEDGSIAGGARWNDTFVRLSTGFLDSMINGFIREAELTTEQERRLRENIRTSAKNIMQVTADFTNGDIDGDAAYEQLEIVAEEGRGKVRQLLNDDQVETFERFQTTIRSIMHRQVVHNEMATLKEALALDAEQEKRILEVVEERYRRVGEKLTTPIPNVYFKPLRREKDKAIYDETARAIRELLSAEQRGAFDAWERKAPQAPFQYRSQLAPK